MTETQEPIAPAPAPTKAKRSRRNLAHLLLVGVVEAVAAFAGLVMLGAGLLAIRLAWGPLEVDFLTPALTTALDAAADPLTVTVGGTSVSWGTGQPTVDLIARDLHVVDPAGTEVLSLPRLAVSLAVRPLLEGRLVPTRLAATGPRVRLVRGPDGSIGLVAGTVPEPAEPGAETGAVSEPWPQLLRSLAAKPRAGDPLGSLREVSVDGLEAVLHDRAESVVLHLAKGHAAATRSPTGVDFRIGGRLGLGNVGTTIDAGLHLDTGARTATLDGAFEALDPGGLAGAMPGRLDWLSTLHFAVSGRLQGVLDVGTMKLGAATFRLQGGAGTVVHPRLAGGHLDIASLDVDAAYDPASDRLDLRRLALDLGGPTIEAAASLAPTGSEGLLTPAGLGRVHAKARLDLRNLPIERFGAVWPPGVAPGARDWITGNMSVGKVEQLRAEGEASYDPSAAEPVALSGATASLAVSGATIDYLSGLPKLEGVDGTIAASPQKIDINVTSGRLQGQGLTMPGGTIAIDGLDSADQWITLDLGLRGPARDVLAVLDAKRLQYTKAMGLTPDRASGSVDGTLHFRFRLKKDLPFSEVAYGAKAQLDGLSLTQAALGADLTDGKFDLTLDHDHVVLDGTGKLAEIPATIRFSQRIGGTAGYRMQAHVAATLDPAARRRLALDFLPDIVRGPIGTTADYRVIDDHRAEAQVALDLTPSDLAIDWFGWSKPADVPGAASFLVAIDQGRVTQLSGLEARAKDLAVKGSLQFADGSLTHAQFDRLHAGAAEFAGTVDHAPGSPWALKLRGPSLDILPIRQTLTAPDTGPPQPDEAAPSLAIEASFDRLLNGPDRGLRDAAVKAQLARRALVSGSLAAKLGTAGTLEFHLEPVEAGGRFAIETDDFGALFKVGRITDDLVGGKLSVTGTAKQDGASRRFTGRAEGKDYRLENMPFMTRLLSLASFQTVASLLSGEGIPFTTLKADLSLEDGRLALQHARAFGGAIGINLDGTIDIKAGMLDLAGTLVPAYTLNSVFGDIPILGPLLVGPEGSGLFAVAIHIYDRLGEPKIDVNPASAVAPGVLRNLFLYDTPGEPNGKPKKK
jgi:hypothetical protein